MQGMRSPPCFASRSRVARSAAIASAETSAPAPSARVIARSVSRRWTVPLAAAGLTAWDLFLDPQMVGEGYWVWESADPAVPGIPGIPAQNYAGWLLSTLVLMTMLNRLPRTQVDLVVPRVLYGWMWIGGIIANAFFLDRPAVALVGGIGMAVLGIPALWARRTP